MLSVRVFGKLFVTSLLFKLLLVTAVDSSELLMNASCQRSEDYRRLTSKVGPTTRDVSTLKQAASIPGRKEDRSLPLSVLERDSVGGLARLK